MNTRVLLDDIKRGKYTLLEKCLKDKNKIKAGDVVI